MIKVPLNVSDMTSERMGNEDYKDGGLQASVTATELFVRILSAAKVSAKDAIKFTFLASEVSDDEITKIIESLKEEHANQGLKADAFSTFDIVLAVLLKLVVKKEKSKEVTIEKIAIEGYVN